MVAMITMLAKLAASFGRRKSRRGWVRRLREWLPILLVLAALGCLRLRLMKMVASARDRKRAPGYRSLSIGSARGSLNFEESGQRRFCSEFEALSSIPITRCTLICSCAQPEISQAPRWSPYAHPWTATALSMCEKCGKTFVALRVRGTEARQIPLVVQRDIVVNMLPRVISTSPGVSEWQELDSLPFRVSVPDGSV